MGAYYHGPKYLLLTNVKLRGIYDIDAEASKRIAHRLNVKKVYSTIDELLKTSDKLMVEQAIPRTVGIRRAAWLQWNTSGDKSVQKVPSWHDWLPMVRALLSLRFSQSDTYVDSRVEEFWA